MPAIKAGIANIKRKIEGNINLLAGRATEETRPVPKSGAGNKNQFVRGAFACVSLLTIAVPDGAHTAASRSRRTSYRKTEDSAEAFRNSSEGSGG